MKGVRRLPIINSGIREAKLTTETLRAQRNTEKDDILAKKEIVNRDLEEESRQCLQDRGDEVEPYPNGVVTKRCEVKTFLFLLKF